MYICVKESSPHIPDMCSHLTSCALLNLNLVNSVVKEKLMAYLSFPLA